MSLRFRRHWGTGNENTGLLMLRLERETGLGYDSREESVAEDVDMLLRRYGGVIDDDDVDDDDVDDDEAYY